MRQFLPHPLLTPILAGIWLLLNNSAAPGQIVLGLILGWAIPLLSIRFWPDQVYIYKPLTLLRYIVVLLVDIVIANFNVAKLILGNPERLKPAFVKLPLDLTSDFAISLLANSITLTPGTLSARLSSDRKYLLIHALHESNPDMLIVTIKQRYERLLKEIFEKC